MPAGQRRKAVRPELVVRLALRCNSALQDVAGGGQRAAMNLTAVRS
jgi:hypothetical protein